MFDQYTVVLTEDGWVYVKTDIMPDRWVPVGWETFSFDSDAEMISFATKNNGGFRVVAKPV